jgi:hypothetical protein
MPPEKQNLILSSQFSSVYPVIQKKLCDIMNKNTEELGLVFLQVMSLSGSSIDSSSNITFFLVLASTSSQMLQVIDSDVTRMDLWTPQVMWRSFLSIYLFSI